MLNWKLCKNKEIDIMIGYWKPQRQRPLGKTGVPSGKWESHKLVNKQGLPLAQRGIYSQTNLDARIGSDRIVELVEIEKLKFDDYFSNMTPSSEKVKKASKKKGGFLCCAPPSNFLKIHL